MPNPLPAAPPPPISDEDRARAARALEDRGYALEDPPHSERRPVPLGPVEVLRAMARGDAATARAGGRALAEDVLRAARAST
jgi:hypothetical protein